MRRIIDLLESTEQTYLHGSPVELQPGTVLVSQGTSNLLDPDIEDILERNRPSGAIPRHEAVYMVKDKRDLEALALRTEHVFHVSPYGPVERRDHAFVNAIWRIVVKNGDDGDNLPPKAKEMADKFAKAYWSGAISKFGWEEPPQLEYLTTAAEVMGEV